MFLVAKPSWSLGVHPILRRSDYAKVFDETIRVAEMIAETGIVVFPGSWAFTRPRSTRLTERMPLAEAAGSHERRT